jgi:hypothetical protein
MRLFLGTILVVIGYFYKSVEASVISAGCKEWTCQDGVGSGTGANRTCAAIFEQSTFGVEECQPDKWLCDAPYTLANNVTCGNYTILPWKDDMPAGDSCNYDEECYINLCNSTSGETKTCAGRAENERCGDDRECYPGFFCNSTNVCGKVAKKNENCTASIRCEFGTQCVNQTCTTFGSLSDGARYYLEDATLDQQTPTLPNQTFWVCKNFYAFYTGNLTSTKLPIYECGGGPDRQFSSSEYKRKVNDDSDCMYTLNFNNGTTKNLTEVAMCGYNHDTNHYCPKRRGGDEYSDANKLDQIIWNDVDFSCHHRSTIQYCRGIEDNAITSGGFRLFLERETLTQGDGYSMIANNQRCSGNNIVSTRGYWRILDSAQGTVMTYFALVVGFIGLAYLY